MSAPDRLPELLSRERFVRIAAHAGFVSEVVGERYAVLVMEVDQMDLVRAREGASIAEACDAIVVERLRKAMPSDAIGSRLREDGFGVLAFGASTEGEAIAFATQLHERIREPIHTHGRQIVLSVSVGIAFTRAGVKAIDALRAAERGVIRVRQNGGDATFISRVAPPVARVRRSGGTAVIADAEGRELA